MKALLLLLLTCPSVAFALIPDNTVPVLQKTVIINAHKIELHFSETLSPTSVKKNHFLLNEAVVPNSATLLSQPDRLQLEFEDPFRQKAIYSLRMFDLQDASGNKLDTTVQFMYSQSGLYDVLINEVYPDPTPSHGLPEYEYAELFNATDFPVNLHGWQFCDKVRCAVLPSVILQSDSVLIVCDLSNQNAFNPYGKTIGLSDFPTLNNTGDQLLLKNKKGMVIHSLHYDKNSYDDDEKSEGGWSIELQYRNHPCLIKGNWAASNDGRGGSPRKTNVTKEKPFLDLEYVTVLDSKHLVVRFNAVLDSTALNAASITLNGQAVSNIRLSSGVPASLAITLSTPLLKRKIYTLHVQGIESCGLVTGVQNEAQFGLPETASSKDIVINEVLFNPYDDGEDFVEIYNVSNKIVNLQTLFLAEEDNGMISKLYPVSYTPFYLLPEGYAAITIDKKGLLKQYFCNYPKNLVEVNNMPAYSNASGRVILVDENKVIIDQMRYNENDHSPFFHNEEGVSLEKINPLISSLDINNWASASTISSYATPGYRNSQFVGNRPPAHLFKVKPEVFSPDGDGMDDEVFLNYTLPSGYAATIRIYNEYGRLVRHLKSNITLSTKGKIPWNGKNDKDRLLPTGIYIFYIGLYHPSGEVITYKLPVTLVKRR